MVIAVLDTGVLYDHPDLGRADRGGKLLPGFDFVSGIAHDQRWRWPRCDPSDPGDWVDSTDKTNAAFTNCDISGSSWHGTRVAGMIGALTNNSAGVAGLDWNSFILPVRVLGKCGGLDSDILAGMRWAAGLHVAGVPDNPTPARILNLSLGSDGACEPSYRDVIGELTALQGAGRGFGRQRRHGGVIAGELPGRRGRGRHSPCRQQGGIQQPRA